MHACFLGLWVTYNILLKKKKMGNVDGKNVVCKNYKEVMLTEGNLIKLTNNK